MNDEVNIRLLIDPITKTIAPKYRTQKAVYVAKGDRNSVRITFEMPRYVDEFDMLEEDNFIHVHYANTDGENVSKGVSEAIDVVEEGDNIVFSWLVSSKATRYAGTLSIGITFERYETVDDKAQEVYSWSTAPYGKVIVWDSLDNTGEFAEEEYDKLVNTCNTLVELASTKAKDEIDDKVATVIKQLDVEVGRAKYNATLSQSYAEGGTGIRDREDWDNAKYYKEDAGRMSAEATASAFLAESYSHGDTGVRDDEDTDNAMYYYEEAKKHAEASAKSAAEAKEFERAAIINANNAYEYSGEARSYSEEAKGYAELVPNIKGDVSGTGAIRLDCVPEQEADLKVNTNAVKSYGKNLTDYRTPISKGTAHSLGAINVPMTVTVDIDESIPFGSVQLAYDDGGQSRVTFASSGKVSRTSVTIDGVNFKFGTYRVTTSSTTEVGAVVKIQLELGNKSTYYEAYKPPVSGAVAISPTTTIVADVEGTELTATYNKDLTLVITEIEKKIEQIETAIANS